MLGLSENIMGQSRFHHASQIHHTDAVAHVSDHTQIVGNKQIGQVEFTLQFFEQVKNLSLNGNIQRRGRFV